MKLSANFSRREIEFSLTAIRKGIKNVIPDHQITLWTEGCRRLLEPIRETNGGHPIQIVSGYRCKNLNTLVHGAKNSLHQGRYQEYSSCAFDIECVATGNLALWKTVEVLTKSRIIPVRAAIWEFYDHKEPAWVHVDMLAIPVPPYLLRIYFNKNGNKQTEKLWEAN